jgi:hypothetical protein
MLLTYLFLVSYKGVWLFPVAETTEEAGTFDAMERQIF